VSTIPIFDTEGHCNLRFVTIAALSVIIAGCNRLEPLPHVKVPADSAANEIGFRMSPRASSVIVPAYINGTGPVDLILDTGSSLTCLDDSLAQELNRLLKIGG